MKVKGRDTDGSDAVIEEGQVWYDWTNKDDAAYKRTLARITKAICMYDKAVSAMEAALAHKDVPFDCGKAASLVIAGDTAEWIARRVFGK